jgi:hypothetical protein
MEQPFLHLTEFSTEIFNSCAQKALHSINQAENIPAQNPAPGCKVQTFECSMNYRLYSSSAVCVVSIPLTHSPLVVFLHHRFCFEIGSLG